MQVKISSLPYFTSYIIDGPRGKEAVLFILILFESIYLIGHCHNIVTHQTDRGLQSLHPVHPWQRVTGLTDIASSSALSQWNRNWNRKCHNDRSTGQNNMHFT